MNCVVLRLYCVPDRADQSYSCGFGVGTAFLRYNQTWKDHRKVLRQEFSASAVQRYRPMLEKGARTLLGNLLQSPQDFMEHLRQ
jgi:cytochrome P450